jgi:hypothetical protein
MDESLSQRDTEARQIVEENAMLDHLVWTFHREPFVPATPRRWRAQPFYDRLRADGGSRR